MEIITIPISTLRFAEYNPRQITDSQFAKLQHSIKEFGFCEPVVVNMAPGREHIIVGGHMRVRAAEKIGYTEVPCTPVYLDERAERTLNLALNRIHGTWDQEKLAEVMIKLQQDGADLRLTGFEDEEIRLVVDEQVPLHGSPEGTEPAKQTLTLEYDLATMGHVMDMLGPIKGETLSDKALAAIEAGHKTAPKDEQQ